MTATLDAAAVTPPSCCAPRPATTTVWACEHCLTKPARVYDHHRGEALCDECCCGYCAAPGSDRAHEFARNVGYVVAAVPVVGDYRPGEVTA